MSNFVMNGYTLDQPDYEQTDLTLYYDVKGKTNRDLYKHILLNMSTSRDYSTIHNVNSTADSGYSLVGLSLDGFDDYVLAKLPKDLTACTFETVIQIDNSSVGNFQTLFQVSYNPQRWLFRLNGFALELVDSTGTVIATTTSVAAFLGKPIYLALYLTSTSCKVKINNVTILDTEITPITLGALGEYLCLGAAFPNSSYTQGTLFSFRLYSAILEMSSATNNFTIDQSRWGIS